MNLLEVGGLRPESGGTDHVFAQSQIDHRLVVL
jgi:hypothetical protein